VIQKQQMQLFWRIVRRQIIFISISNKLELKYSVWVFPWIVSLVVFHLIVFFQRYAFLKYFFLLLLQLLLAFLLILFKYNVMPFISMVESNIMQSRFLNMKIIGGGCKFLYIDWLAMIFCIGIVNTDLHQGKKSEKVFKS
jgi:hypothetical protein